MPLDACLQVLNMAVKNAIPDYQQHPAWTRGLVTIQLDL
jgi:hypothetical protein